MGWICHISCMKGLFSYGKILSWERGWPFELGRQDRISKITVAAMAVWTGVSAGIFRSSLILMPVCLFASASFGLEAPSL